MELSVRMRTVADLVSAGGCVADIGTDHGYIPIDLVRRGVAQKAIAMDVNQGPLSRASANIEKYGLAGRIEVRLSDGLDELRAGEADSLIIAGMGGLLMTRILEEGADVLASVQECILQPQSDVDSVRRFLHTHDFQIVQENMVVDDGKYYVMMRAIHGVETDYDAADDLYGRLLIDSGHPVLRAYLEKEVTIMDEIAERLSEQSSEKSKKRLAKLREERVILDAALARIAAVHNSG